MRQSAQADFAPAMTGLGLLLHGGAKLDGDDAGRHRHSTRGVGVVPVHRQVPEVVGSVAAAQLRAQRAWLEWRTQECAHLHLAWSPGTIRQQVAADCWMTLTAARAAEFRARLGLEAEE